MKKKLFYFNLNNCHDAGERSMRDFNRDDVEWHRTIDSPEVGTHWILLEHSNFSKYMTANETGKPIFDYYNENGSFCLKEIQKLYRGTDVKINEKLFNEILTKIDKNIELVKELEPDIIFLRFYSYYEYFLLYFLDGIRDVPAFKCIGGADLDFNNWYYIDKFLESGLIDNFHDGYGEHHLQNILNADKIPEKTTCFDYRRDDFSVPNSEVHWIINTIKCNGICKFCVHNRTARQLIQSEEQFTSDDYIHFVTDRLKYFQESGVKQVFVPASITFYNTNHLKRFYEIYKSKGISLTFVDAYFKFEDLNAETVPLLKDMGFHSIKIGLETINEHLRGIVGKSFKNELVYEATRLLNQYDIKFKYSFIYNFPFSDHFDLVRDLQFIKEWDLGYFGFNRFEIYNGTEIEQKPEEHNLIKRVSDSGYIFYERDRVVFHNNIYARLEKQVHGYLYNKENLQKRTNYHNGYIENIF